MGVSRYMYNPLPKTENIINLLEVKVSNDACIILVIVRLLLY